MIKSKAVKRRVDCDECHRELRLVGGSTGCAVEDGLGATHRPFRMEHRLRRVRPLSRLGIELCSVPAEVSSVRKG